MLKRVDLAVYETVKAFLGSSLHAGRVSFDLRSGGIGFATSGGFVDDIKDRLESLEAKIVHGEITVPGTP
jgi:basic membrane protein A